MSLAEEIPGEEYYGNPEKNAEKSNSQFSSARTYLTDICAYDKKDKTKIKDVQKFLSSILSLSKHSCIVCDCLFRRDNIRIFDIARLPYSITQHIFPDYRREQGNSPRQICLTCIRYMKSKKLPPHAILNGFPEFLHLANCPELGEMSTMERSLIATYRPCIKIFDLPSGQQKAQRGLCIQLFADIPDIISTLPLTPAAAGIVYVRQKNKAFSQKLCLINVARLKTVLSFLVQLENPLMEGIILDESTLQSLASHQSLDDADELESELEHSYLSPIHSILTQEDCSPTIVDLKELTGGPVNRKTPHWEAGGFPHLHPDGLHDFSSQRPVSITLGSYLKRMFNQASSRFRNDISYLLFMSNLLDQERLFASIRVALRKIFIGDGRTTRGDLNDHRKIFAQDQAFSICSQIRGTDPYWKEQLGDLFARFSQCGPPTFFVTLSANDTGWPDVFCAILGISNVGDLPELSYKDRQILIRANPVSVVRHLHRRISALISYIVKGKSHPLGDVLDYYIRVEFQMRGTPHYHCFFWTKGAPNVHTAAGLLAAPAFIDKYISVALPCKSKEPLMYELVSTLQTHNCTGTCRRNQSDARCRFDYPLPVCETTCVKLSPQIAKRFYYLKRSVDETRVNAYNSDILKMWGANMDIQMVHSSYGLAMYVLYYITKSEPSAVHPGILDALHNAGLDMPLGGLQSMLQKVGLQVIGKRRVSAQEAALKVLGVPYIYASRATVFLNTNQPNRRIFVLKTAAALSSLDADSTDLFITAKIEYYFHRPRTPDFESMSAIKFLMVYQVKKKGDAPKRTASFALEPPFDTHICYVRTHCHCIKVRSVPHGIHFEEDYSYHMLYTFFPFRNEADLLGIFSTFTEHFAAVKNSLDLQSLPFMEYGEGVRQAMRDRDMRSAVSIEQIQLLLSETSTIHNIEDAEQMMYDEALTIQSSAFQEMVIQTFEEVMVTQQDKTVSGPKATSITDFNAELSKLNTEQKYIFEHVIEQNRLKKQVLLFLTGGGGNGKSFWINTLSHYFAVLNPGKLTILLAAPTGVAAYSINGQTLHSLFRLTIKKKGMKSSLSFIDPSRLATMRHRFQHVTHLIVDEVSMISNELLLDLHFRLQQVFLPDLPFGGLTVIVAGDLFQLPPVKAKFIFDESDKAAHNLWLRFQCFVLRKNQRQLENDGLADFLSRLRLGSSFPADEALLESVRNVHVDNPNFENAMRIYMNNASVDAYNALRLESISESPLVKLDAITTLKSGHSMGMANLPGGEAECGGLSNVLGLKIGAKVMLTRNQCVQDGLYNGAIGKIYSFECNFQGVCTGVNVLFDDQTIGKVLGIPAAEGFICKIFPSQAKFEGKNHTVWVRVQFPLRLAWATTAHKAQGLTLIFIIVFLHDVFVCGQSYTALSRVKTLAGLSVGSLNFKRMINFQSGPQHQRIVLEYIRLQRCFPKEIIAKLVKTYQSFFATLEIQDCDSDVAIRAEREKKRAQSLTIQSSEPAMKKPLHTTFCILPSNKSSVSMTDVSIRKRKAEDSTDWRKELGPAPDPGKTADEMTRWFSFHRKKWAWMKANKMENSVKKRKIAVVTHWRDVLGDSPQPGKTPETMALWLSFHRKKWAWMKTNKK